MVEFGACALLYVRIITLENYLDLCLRHITLKSRCVIGIVTLLLYELKCCVNFLKLLIASNRIRYQTLLPNDVQNKVRK